MGPCMDGTTLLLIAAGVAALAIIAALLIWRSRSETVVRVPTSPQEIGGPPGPSQHPSYSAAELADLAASGRLVEIIHPLVRRSAEQALEKGGPMARYIVRYEGKLWLTFEPMPDPQQREIAYDLFRRFNAGEQVDIRAMIDVVRMIGK